MNREDFEQLVSAWLDEPGRADLRALIDTAVRENPRLAAVLDEWRRLGGLLRRDARELDNIDWSEQQARISFALHNAASVADADAEDEALDAVLRGLPRVDDLVDWSRFHGRVSTAVARAARPGAARRRRHRWIAGAAGVLAAAAALLLAVIPNTGPPVPSAGMVRVTVSGPPPCAAAYEGVAYVRVADMGPPKEQPEVFFMIEPIKTTRPSDETAGYY